MKGFLMLAAVAAGTMCAGAAEYPARGDAAEIAAKVAAARAEGRHEVVVPRRNPRSGDDLWIIERTVELPSGMTVILDGAHLVFADGVFCNMFRNERANAKNRNTLAAEDRDVAVVGRNGATLDGGNYNCWGEQWIPGKRGLFYGTDEHRAALRKAGDKRLTDNSFIYFHNVKGFRVEGLRLHHQRYWACCFSFCERGVIRDIRFEADISWVSLDGKEHRPNCVPGNGENLYLKNGDGIDLRKGCNNILVENLSGWSEDDMLAMTNLAGGLRDAVEGKCHDIHHITVRNVRGTTFIWFNLIRLLCADGAKIHDIDIDGVRDEFEPRMPWRAILSAVQINDHSKEYYRERPAVMGEVKDVTIRNVVSGASQPLHLFGPIENLTVEGVHLLPGAHCVADVMFDAEFRNTRISRVTADESVKLCSILDFVGVKGEVAVDDVRVSEVKHLSRNCGDAKFTFTNLKIGRITEEREAKSDPDGRHVAVVELPNCTEISEGL